MTPRIDSHTHLFPPALRERRLLIADSDATFREMYADPKAKMATRDELAVAMADARLDAAVCAGFAFHAGRDIEEQNAYLLTSGHDNPERVLPLATVNLEHAGWRTVAEGALQSGARGFGELRPHNQGWDPLGVNAHELCELAGAANAVLLWHVSEPLGHRYAGKRGGIAPTELAHLAAAHPHTKMIAAHLGGGLSFYLQMPEVKKSLRNVWFDTAAAFLLYDRKSVSRLLGLAGYGRVLFASDYPLLSPRRQLELLESSLPVGAVEAVFGGNAKTLFSDTHGQ